MEEVFGPGGLIAQHHPNYEYRPGQVEMAEAVQNVLADGGTALIEAGTGTDSCAFARLHKRGSIITLRF